MRVSGASSSGATAGLKFVVNLSIEGQGEAQLQRVADMFGKIESAADKTTSSVERVGKAFFLREGFEKMEEVGTGLIELGVGFAEAWVSGFEQVIGKAAELEQVYLRMRASGQTPQQSHDMMEQTLKAASQLPLTELQAAQAVQVLALAHVDGFKQIGASYEELARKGRTMPGLMEELAPSMKKLGATPLSLMADVLATTNNIGNKRAINQIGTLISGGYFHAQSAFGALTPQLRAVAKASGGAEGRVKALFEMLQKTGSLGVSAAAMNTFAGQMTNLKGILDLIVYRIMDIGTRGGLMDRFVKGFGNLVDTVRSFFLGSEESEKFLAAIKGIGSMLMDVLVPAMEKFAAGIKGLFTWIGNNPALAKLIVALSFAAAGFAVLTGVVLVAGGALGVFLTVLFIVPEALLLIPIAIGVVVAGFMALIGVFGLAVAAYEIWENNFGGIRDFFEDIGLVITAFGEAFKTWHNGIATISLETANKLQKRGLLHVFLSIGNVMYQAQVIWEKVSKAIGEAWDENKDLIIGGLGRIRDAVESTFTYFIEMVGAGQEATDKAGESGHTMGDTIKKSLHEMAEAFDKAIPKVHEISRALVGLWTWGRKTADVFIVIADAIGRLISAIDLLAAIPSNKLTNMGIVLNYFTDANTRNLRGEFAAAYAKEVKEDVAAREAEIEQLKQDVFGHHARVDSAAYDYQTAEGDAERFLAKEQALENQLIARHAAEDANEAGLTVPVGAGESGPPRPISADDLKDFVEQFHRRPNKIEVKVILDGKQIKASVDQHTSDSTEYNGGPFNFSEHPY